jgi:hypothetical protein
VRQSQILGTEGPGCTSIGHEYSEEDLVYVLAVLRGARSDTLASNQIYLNPK